MKIYWAVVLIIGIVAMISAFFMPMTAPGTDTNNLGLMADRLVWMIAAAAVFVVGGVGLAVSAAVPTVGERNTPDASGA